MDLKEELRHVMDFPKEGIDFIDITTVLQNGEAFKQAIDEMKEQLDTFGDFDLIASPESRGFIFGPLLSYLTGKGFIPIRKKGKLPHKTVSVKYELEYGFDELEMHIDSIKKDQKIILVDDLLATGGTAISNISLIEKLGGNVTGILYLIELTFLKGIEKFNNYNVKSIVKL
ncbi:MAG: adenine phosphoribosyltransferase [Clostridiales bacterium]